MLPRMHWSCACTRSATRWPRQSRRWSWLQGLRLTPLGRLMLLPLQRGAVSLKPVLQVRSQACLNRDHAVLCCAALCCALLCSALLRLLCSVLSCCPKPCHAVLCHVVPLTVLLLRLCCACRVSVLLSHCGAYTYSAPSTTCAGHLITHHLVQCKASKSDCMHRCHWLPKRKFVCRSPGRGKADFQP